MGWVSSDNKHEGWVACVAPDGRLSSSSSGEGMLVKGVSGRYKRDESMPDYEIIPDREIIGWRGACDCGWQGELWKRVGSSAEADPAQHREYVSRDGFADASQRLEEAVHDEWKAHIAPTEAILGVEAAAREYSQAGNRLNKTVAAAKAAGASWTDIGRAVGISRQSAHERWSDKK
ncbi:hypothetical protein ACFVYC_20830 [Pseudarthrobacter sp. NPDC058329]|uniref:hypothetical protein n=1 Tax=Pseudarthrobacter sp. NPDC058329 TaxID=3346448 RepID=UPI0036D8048E